MKIIPPTTQPPAIPFARSHRPKLAAWKEGYHVYRSCLRWEFGFTCALCLLHEADLVEYGIATTGLTTIEHIIPRSADPKQDNHYSNCLYACRFCNRARSTAPLCDQKGNQLLDPTLVAWAEHFEARDDRLIPKTGHGEYTEATYRINDPLKVKRRSARREDIHRCWQLLRDGLRQIRCFMSLSRDLAASDKPRERHNAIQLNRAAAWLEDQIKRARKFLERYQGVPHDADKACRCQMALQLPPQLEQQLVNV